MYSKHPVSRGGYLFESCCMFGTDEESSQITCARFDASDERSFAPLKMNTLYKPFYFHVLSVLARMGQSVQHQRFLLTFYLDCKGTSNTGLETLSRSGLVMARTSFLRHRRRVLLGAQAQIRFFCVCIPVLLCCRVLSKCIDFHFQHRM